MTKSIILIGGFPKPIGGVTTFVRRLAASDKRIEEVVDIYFNNEKEIPKNYLGKYKKLNNKWHGFMYLFIKMMTWHNKYIHFNFSSLKSLAFFVLMPKHKTNWILMLHHGVLENSLPVVLVKYLLHRFDHIFCLNELQYNFFREYGICSSKLLKASSYVKPTASEPDEIFQQDIDSYFSSKPTFIASGSPRTLYNLDWCIRFVGERAEYQLALFIYGDGSEKSAIKEQVSRYPNTRVYWDQREDNFNYALSKAFYYLRPNMKDSFGIAVADAVNYGVPVLASDVCPRFQGASTFTITSYESFEGALLDSLNKEIKTTNPESTPFVPFTYDLIK